MTENKPTSNKFNKVDFSADGTFFSLADLWIFVSRWKLLFLICISLAVILVSARLMILDIYYQSELALEVDDTETLYIQDPPKLQSALVSAFSRPELTRKFANVFIDSLQKDANDGNEVAKMGLMYFLDRFSYTKDKEESDIRLDEAKSEFSTYLHGKMVHSGNPPKANQFQFKVQAPMSSVWHIQFFTDKKGISIPVAKAAAQALVPFIEAYNSYEKKIRQANLSRRAGELGSTYDAAKEKYTVFKNQYERAYLDLKVEYYSIENELSRIAKRAGISNFGQGSSAQQNLKSMLVQNKDSADLNAVMEKYELDLISYKIAELSDAKALSSEERTGFLNQLSKLSAARYKIADEKEAARYLLVATQDLSLELSKALASPLNTMDFALPSAAYSEDLMTAQISMGKIDQVPNNVLQILLFLILAAFAGSSSATLIALILDFYSRLMNQVRVARRFKEASAED